MLLSLLDTAITNPPVPAIAFLRQTLERHLVQAEHVLKIALRWVLVSAPIRARHPTLLLPIPHHPRLSIFDHLG